MNEFTPQRDAYRHIGLAARDVAPAILWLSDRGVSEARIGTAFGLSHVHVRVLKHRVRRRTAATPSQGFGKVDDVRRERGYPEYSPGYRAHLEELELDSEGTWYRVQRTWDLDFALKEFARLRQAVGYPSSIELKRLVARNHQLRAWCLVHKGQPTIALREAARAMAIYRDLCREGDRIDLIRIGETTLIGAQAALFRHDRIAAERWLSDHRVAHSRTGEALNVDYFRQRGVLAAQLEREDEAIAAFRQAAKAVQDVDAPWWAAHASRRPLSLLGKPDPTAARLALEEIEACGGEGIEQFVARRWAVAVSLACGGREAAWAREELEGLTFNSHFYRERLITFYLKSTDPLGLNNEALVAWIRWALEPEIAT